MRRTTTALVLAALVATMLGLAGTPAGAQEAPQGAPEIIGGAPASAGEYPYQVGLVFNGVPGIPVRGQFCGGSLISPDTVLTAAHCVVSDIDIRFPRGADFDDPSTWRVIPILERPQNIDVIAGTVNLGASGGGERLHVRRVRVAPDFSVDANVLFGWSGFNAFLPDVAILQLASPSTLGTPVDLAVPGQEALYAGGTPATATGWGITDAISGAPTTLQHATLPMVSDADCTTAYGTDFDAVRNVCAGDLPTGLPSTCYGDSGGPLVVDNGGEPLQVGVVLGGDGCGAAERPSVFSRVAPNQDFLGRYLDPDEVPDRPRHVVLTQRGSVLRVSWRSPVFDGGTKITGFSVVVPGVGIGIAGVDGSGRHVDIDLGSAPFLPGRRYTVKVRATNAVGTSAPRERSIVLQPFALPGR